MRYRLFCLLYCLSSKIFSQGEYRMIDKPRYPDLRIKERNLSIKKNHKFVYTYSSNEKDRDNKSYVYTGKIKGKWTLNGDSLVLHYHKKDIPKILLVKGDSLIDPVVPLERNLWFYWGNFILFKKK